MNPEQGCLIPQTIRARENRLMDFEETRDRINFVVCKENSKLFILFYSSLDEDIISDDKALLVGKHQSLCYGLESNITLILINECKCYRVN